MEVGSWGLVSLRSLDVVIWHIIRGLVCLNNTVNSHYHRFHVCEFAYLLLFTSVQSLSHVRLFATAWTAAHQASLSISNSLGLLKFMSIESVKPSNHLILCCPLLLLPSIFPSIRVFSNESVVLIRWPKYWSFSFSISPSNEHPGLISFRMDCGWISLLSKGFSRVLSRTEFKSFNSSALNFLYSPTLTIHDYWKNHRFDQVDLCWQSDISAF